MKFTRQSGLWALAALCLLISRVYALNPPTYPDPGTSGPFDVAEDGYMDHERCSLDRDGNFSCDLPCDQKSTSASLQKGNKQSVELTASVRYPKHLTRAFPLVIFLHGGHPTCYRCLKKEGSQDQECESSSEWWPCPKDWHPIPSYQGFNSHANFQYVSNILASHGYIVVSISANGVNASFPEAEQDRRRAREDRRARAQLIQAHLNLWKNLNENPDCKFLQGRFFQKVMLNNIGMMGHSLGAAGVVRNFLHNKNCKPKPGVDCPFGIRAILTLAPYFDSSINASSIDVPLAVMLPYCDGDLSHLPGIGYYDRVWYNARRTPDPAYYDEKKDTSPKHLILVMGANHNYYNWVWTPGLFPAGTSDDWKFPKDPFCGSSSPNRLSPEQERGTGIAYITGFFRIYLEGQSRFLPMLTGDAPPPPSAMTNNVLVSYHAPAHLRRDVNRLLDEKNLRINNLCCHTTENLDTRDLRDQHDLRDQIDCGRVDWSGQRFSPTLCKRFSYSCVPSFVPQNKWPEVGKLDQLHLKWEDTSAFYRNKMPTCKSSQKIQDVSHFKRLQFRVGVDLSFGLKYNFCESFQIDPGGKSLRPIEDFHVVLSDGKQSAAVLISNFYRNQGVLNPLYQPPGSYKRGLCDRRYPIPRTLLNMVSIPIPEFKAVNDQIDLTDIQSITFKFDQPTSSKGAIFISDIAFSKDVELSK